MNAAGVTGATGHSALGAPRGVQPPGDSGSAFAHALATAAPAPRPSATRDEHQREGDVTRPRPTAPHGPRPQPERRDRPERPDRAGHDDGHASPAHHTTADAAAHGSHKSPDAKDASSDGSASDNGPASPAAVTAGDAGPATATSTAQGSGAVTVTGPTGSGTTTDAAATVTGIAGATAGTVRPGAGSPTAAGATTPVGAGTAGGRHPVAGATGATVTTGAGADASGTPAAGAPTGPGTPAPAGPAGPAGPGGPGGPSGTGSKTPTGPQGPAAVPQILPDGAVPQPSGAPTTTPAAPAAPAAAPGAPAAPPAPVTTQLVAAVAPFWRGPDGSYSLQLQLHPADLGAVQVLVEVRHGEVNVQLHASDGGSSDLLRTSLPDLREQLEGQGLRAGSLDVGTGGTGTPGGRPGQRVVLDPAATGGDRSLGLPQHTLEVARAKTGTHDQALDLQL